MIHMTVGRVIGTPWYYLGRNAVARQKDDNGRDITWGPMRWTERGAQRALIKAIGASS